MSDRQRFIILWILVVVTMVASTLVAIAAQPADAQAATPEATADLEAPTPLVMLTIFDPWRMVIGSDTPRFVVYDSGQVIYVRENTLGEYEHVSVTLDKAELDALISDLVDPAFFALDEYYDTIMITDQPTSTVSVWDEAASQAHTVSVYGDVAVVPEVREAAPEAFVALHDRLLAYTHPDAEPWLPPVFELVVWEYDSSDAVALPDDFPTLDSPTTIRRDSVYSLYVPMARLDAFRDRVADASALLIDGQTWTWSVRYPFPHEGVYPVAG